MGGQTPREPHGAGRASPRPAHGRARAAWAVSADSAGTTVLRPARRTDGNVRPTPAESWDMWGHLWQRGRGRGADANTTGFRSPVHAAAR